MSKAGTKVYSDRKVDYYGKVLDLLRGYSRVFVVQADNVGSKQMQQIRLAIRGKAILLMGKNTMIRKAFREVMPENPALERLLPLVRGNIGLVFTTAELSEIKELLLANRVPAAAKAGAISPVDVVVPKGPTPLDPGQTSFFQALNIATKINRGTIEILSDVNLINVGDKVGSSEAALLDKLGIRPFTYGLEIEYVYDNGSVFGAEILDLTDDDLLERFLQGVNNIACVSLATGFPTLAALPHVIINAYKNVLAIAVETEYTFAQAEPVKAYLADPSAFAAAAPAAGEAAAEEEKAESEEEESDDDMGFSLFD